MESPSVTQYPFRVTFGPDLVMLAPDEHFTQLSLSGGKPKRPNCIRSLCLLLGPDFMTDIITVETSDHARLALQLSYNWYVALVTILTWRICCFRPMCCSCNHPILKRMK